jgi:3-oxoacyl-[acyl-carrier-protein] synthase-1
LPSILAVATLVALVPPTAHVVALAARTAVGLLPETTAAAVRAGICRVKEHPRLVDGRGEPLRAAYDARLDEDVPCSERMVAMAEHCLAQLVTRVPMHPSVSLPLLLALPESRPGFTAANEQALEQRLVRARAGLRLHSVRTVARGHAGGLEALHVAAQLVSTTDHQACVVGGVESWLEPRTLAWLSSRRRLATAGSRSAFFPGEGACFALVLGHAARRSLGLPSLGTIRSSGVATERCSLVSGLDNLGLGLTAAIRDACAGLGGTGGLVDEVYCDLNGESYRAQEWGLAILRTHQWIRDPAGHVAPADCWGDLGAATGTALAMLPVAAWQRGYARGPLALLFAGSDSGRRAAVVLERPQA